MENPTPENQKFLVACYACIFHKEQILLVRQGRGYWQGLWVLPGGRLQLGESLEDCTRREALEETNSQVQILQQTGTYLSYDPESTFEKQVVLVAYLARYAGGCIQAESDAGEVRWAHFEEITPLREVGKLPDLMARMIYDARLRAKDWLLR